MKKTSVTKLLNTLNSLQFSIYSRKKFLTAEEFERVNAELDYGKNIAPLCDSEEDMIQRIANNFKPFYPNVSTVLHRIHEIAGCGTLSSCLSSLNIVQALFDLNLCDSQGVKDPNLIIGRGHIAPLFYAIRHLQHGMPLIYLLAIHDVVPAVVNKLWGFANTMRHSLGEGLGIAVGKALTRTNTDTVFCFVGDGELNEGISFEAIRLAYDKAIKNFVVIIDNNGKGIEPLPKQLNTGYLASFFESVIQVDGHNTQEISYALKQAVTGGQRTAIVCNTNKRSHSYKRIGSQKKPTTCGQVAEIIRQYQKHSTCHVFTADLAARFGLGSDDTYTNVGLAEASMLALTMGAPDAHMKFVLTDDKYYLNSLDVLQSALAATQNLHIIASRKNQVWGGPTCVPSVFSAITQARVFELSDPEDIRYFMADTISRGENGLYLLYDQPISNVQLLRKNYFRLTPDTYIRYGKTSQPLVISSESVAYEASYLTQIEECTHIRMLTTRPKLLGQLAQKIISYPKIAVIEHNTGRAGLAEYIESELLIRVHKIYADDYDCPSNRTFQSEKVYDRLESFLRKNTSENPFSAII